MNRARHSPLRVGIHAGARLDGGMARYSIELVRALANHDGIAVVPLGTKVVIDSFADLDLPTTRVLPDGQFAECAAVRFRARHWLASRVDLFHGTRHFLPMRSPVPGVLTVQDALMFDDREAFDRPKRWILPHFFASAIREAGVIVVASESANDRLLAHFPEVAGRTRVIPLGLARGVTEAIPEPVPVALPFAMYVGDLSPRKNVAFLLDLWPAIWRQHGVRLLLVGTGGWRSNDIQDRLASGVDGVTWLGFVPDNQLRWLYEHATVVVNPSVYEGTGLPVAEALALGAPVITNTEPAMIETARGYATHVSVADPAAWVVALEAAFAAPSRQPVDFPDTSGWVDATVAAYEECLAAVGRQARR